MKENWIPPEALPSWDDMPSFSDENIGDVIQLLYALIDACEQHYADPLHRWRELRYLELCRDDHQYDLPLDECGDEPF